MTKVGRGSLDASIGGVPSVHQSPPCKVPEPAAVRESEALYLILSALFLPFHEYVSKTFNTWFQSTGKKLEPFKLQNITMSAKQVSRFILYGQKHA